MTAYAFQCQDCGHLEVGAAAGSRSVPFNCRHCDIGSHLVWVQGNPDADDFGFPVEQDTEGAVPRQVVDRANPFTVLADLSEAEQADILAKRANSDDTIERYEPKGGKKK